MPKNILIIAGEASGDRLGGALMEALTKRHPDMVFFGAGGELMHKRGLKPIFPMSDIAVMGLLEVIPSIPRILKRLGQINDIAATTRIDLVITIDAQEFSARLAKRLKPYNIPHVQYVAPKAWAWREKRVEKIATLYNHLLTILPFEQTFFGYSGIPATYVGHPAVPALAPFKRYPKPAGAEMGPPVLALLPGSRKTELKRHWPLFLKTYRSLKAHVPGLTAVLALPTEADLKTCLALSAWTSEDAITPVYGEARFPALAKCTAALSKSGTNNLELGLIGVPAVVAYRMNSLTYAIAKMLVRVPFISLPNLILHHSGQGPVYPEYIQGKATLNNLGGALLALLQGQPQVQAQQASLQNFQRIMQTPQLPAEMAAQVVEKELKL